MKAYHYCYNDEDGRWIRIFSQRPDGSLRINDASWEHGLWLLNELRKRGHTLLYSVWS